MACNPLSQVAEDLYCCLSGTSQEKAVSSLCQQLQLYSERELRSAIRELKDCGLDIHENEGVVFAHYQALDIGWIEKTLKDRNINKKLTYQFQVESTNTLVTQANSIGLTEYQNRGYGRQSRQWLSPMGAGLPVSVNHPFRLPMQKLSGLSLMIGYNLVNVLNRFSEKKFQIKWPNDVIGKGGKVAGILIQAKPHSQTVTNVIVGVGINWSLNDSQLQCIDYPCMNAGVQSLSRSEFLVELLMELEKGFRRFEDSGLESLVSQWQDVAAYIDETVHILDANHKATGKYLGIDAEGHLLLDTDSQVMKFTNGAVSLRKVDF